MGEVKDSADRHHPNDPEVVAHQMYMAAVAMTKDERETLLVSVVRQLAEIEHSQPADE